MSTIAQADVDILIISQFFQQKFILWMLWIQNEEIINQYRINHSL